MQIRGLMNSFFRAIRPRSFLARPSLRFGLSVLLPNKLGIGPRRQMASGPAHRYRGQRAWRSSNSSSLF
jgi:hypothetical protein